LLGGKCSAIWRVSRDMLTEGVLGDNWTQLRRLVFIDKCTGVQSSVTVRLSRPLWTSSSSEAVCRVWFDGHFESPCDIYGPDLTQVNRIAIEFVDVFLSELASRMDIIEVPS
jgi:hypothetical protein